MSIVSTCPHCGTKHRLADDSKAGKKIRCKECEEPFTVKAEKSAKGPAKPRGGAPAGLPPRTGGVKTKTKKKKAKAAREDAEKKPAQKRKPSTGKSPALIGGICVLGLGLLIGLPLLFPGDEPIQAPESYSTFTHDVNSVFKIEYPEGWTVESGGTQGAPVWAKFRHPDHKVLIQVKSSMGASAIGDIAKNLPGGIGGVGAEMEEEDLAPVASVHQLMKDQFAGEYGDDYQEQPPQKIETGFGDTRVSEFTASGSFGSKIRGMRASMLGLDLQFTVICDCPEDDWDVCKPIFERAIKSMSRG